MNYLALSGILYKFRRLAKKNAPSPPANFLADFASGSLHLFNQILQALYLRRPNTVLDVSLTHSTLYLSQLELLKEVQYGSLNRNRSKEGVAVTPFTRPHELVFQDKDGVRFVLKAGTHIYEEIKLQWFNDEESEEARVLGETMQLAFNGMTIGEIEKEYGQVERIKEYRQMDRSSIPENVFDLSGKNKSHEPQIPSSSTGMDVLKTFGVSDIDLKSALIGKL
jgi:hypothetical protein